jgi:hypothetical protein
MGFDMVKILSSLMLLAILSGCGCVSEPKDDGDVSGYFSGCWSTFKGEKPQASKQENNKQEKINKE